MTTATLAAPSRAAAAPRFDLYGPIHKALRRFMADVLTRLAAMDIDDPVDTAAVLERTRTLLTLMEGHVRHENEFVHPALEARSPGASGRIAGQHEDHLNTLCALMLEVDSLQRSPRADAAQRLYRHFALFVAENLEHMHAEETVHSPALWAAYTDAELVQIHDALVASIPADEMALVLRWMVPALTPQERAGMLAGMQAQMPPEAFRGVLEIVQPALDAASWAKLARALNLPPVPGLMTV